MKKLGYYFFKFWVSIGLFFYYKKIKVVGLDNIPKSKPIVFLSNHQNALLDILLIATRPNLKPWYLTRSDVFKSKLFRPLFYFLQMIPIYRIRDGKASLSKNEGTFNRCGELLNKNETLLIFPEANHNLKRRVRPLSKGFTRIIFNALEKNPSLDIQLVPIGQNYSNATKFPDSAALYFGKPIAVQDFLADTKNDTILGLKEEVAKQLRVLTTHIDDDENYDAIHQNLVASGVDFLNPIEVNNRIKKPKTTTNKSKRENRFVKLLMVLLNLPVVFIWRTFIKPKVPEPEFMGTFRFVFCLLLYPIIYLSSFIILSNAFTIKTAYLIIFGHPVLNIFLVKVSATSSHQRK